MKKLVYLFISLLLSLSFHTNAMAAALPSGTLLTIDKNFQGANSYFTMLTGTSLGSWTTTFIRSTDKTTGLPHPQSTDGGILLGVAQPAGSGSHFGPPIPTDTGPIDAPWSFFTNTGHHFTVGTGITDNGDGTLDMTNWRMAWHTIPPINLGGDPLNFAWNTGLGTFTVVGTNYTVDYAANVPLNDFSGFGGVPYNLHIEGRVVAVPEPSSLLLIGSGLAGLWGLMRKR